MGRRCLIIGSALNWRDDVEAALELSQFEHVVAAKRAGTVWPGKLDAWVFLHPEQVDSEMLLREVYEYPKPTHVVTHAAHSKARNATMIMNHLWPGQNISGSSGLFAVKVAQEVLGCDRNVLCGVPIDTSFGKIGTTGPWSGSRRFRKGFEQAMPFIASTCRSMSGFTAELLGKPTREWLQSV